MATIVLRSVKGSPLTNDEGDANIFNLNQELSTKLNSSAYTASDVFSKVLSLDGSNSGLDADLLDGLNTSTQLPATIDKSSVVIRDVNGNFEANVITATLNGTATGITGIVPVDHGGTGVTTSTGTGSVVLNSSPTLTGIPTTPTPTGSNANQITNVTYVSSAITGKADKNSPVFTGTPQAPTAAVDTVTLQIANAAFVVNQINKSGANSQGTRTVEPVSAGVPSNTVGSDGDIRYQY